MELLADEVAASEASRGAFEALYTQRVSELQDAGVSVPTPDQVSYDSCARWEAASGRRLEGDSKQTAGRRLQHTNLRRGEECSDSCDGYNFDGDCDDGGTGAEYVPI